MLAPRAGIAAALAAVAAAFAAPAPASADQTIQAALRDRFTASSATIAQGESLTFENLDIDRHNVTATRSDASGSPLFMSKTVGAGMRTPVAGAERLAAGTYGYLCSIHPQMTGTLVVTAGGVPHPGTQSPAAQAGLDTEPPDLRLRILSADVGTVRRIHALRVRVALDEPAEVRLVVRAAGRTIGSAVIPGAAARRTVRVRLRLRSLPRGRAVRVSVHATAVDAAFNQAVAAAARTLRR